MILILIFLFLAALFGILSILSFKSDTGKQEEYIGSIFGMLFAVISGINVFLLIFDLAVKLFANI